MKVLAAATDLGLGARCPGCRAPGMGLCVSCRRKLLTLEIRRVRRGFSGFPPTWAAHTYAGLVAQLLIEFKERRAWWLARYLALPLSKMLSVTSGARLLLVPIPSRPSTVRARGEDVVLRLAEAVRADGIRAGPLLAHRGAQDQGALSAKQRELNVANAFLVKRSSPRSILLVDDIVTTGATLAGAARALERSGHQVLGAVTVAETCLKSE